MKGRLLRNGAIPSNPKDGYLISLLKTFLRAFSFELKNYPLNLIFDSKKHELTTNKEGYFELVEVLENPQEKPSELQIILTKKDKDVTISVPLRKYMDSTGVGIISDIDDTILVSKVRSNFKFRLLINTLFINPFRRKEIDNAAIFYHQLLKSRNPSGPIIYISNSPWNIYGYLKDFINHNKFPNGEIILRDFGVQLIKRKKSIENHNKFKEVNKCLMLFPKTKFILIGDSAESDFNIYKTIAQKMPERIKQVIIIKAGNPKNEQDIHNTIGEEKLQNYLLIDNYQDLILKS